MPTPAKPLPTITPLDAPFWEATRRHHLALQRCDGCGAFRYPASPVCPECDSDRFAWTPTSGHGRILSWVVFHRCYFPSFQDEMPYNVAMITLDEGPVIISNVIGTSNDRLRKDLPVEVVFDDVDDKVSIPKFRLVER